MKAHLFAPLLTFLLSVFLILSCNYSKKESKSIEFISEPVEYPVGYISKYIHTHFSDSHKLYPLPDEFVDVFISMHTRYEGMQPTVATDFPTEWGVVLVERLPEGRELYQIQSKNREWVYLVTTSGYGTLRILDVLPVAVNLVNQTHEILETEIWTTEREPDGSFIVTKQYERVHSVENVSHQEYETNPLEYLRTKTVSDKYCINSSCKFELIENEDATEYAAVFFYYKEEKQENWSDNMSMLQAFCEDYSILFKEVRDNFDKVSLYDYKYNFVVELDITPFIDIPEGLIFMKKGETPKTVPIGSFERMKIELKRYFKIIE